MGFLRRVIDFVSHPTHSRTMGVVIMLVLVSAVSLTVIAAQQQQTLKQRAAEISLDCQNNAEEKRTSCLVGCSTKPTYEICINNCDSQSDQYNNSKNWWDISFDIVSCKNNCAQPDGKTVCEGDCWFTYNETDIPACLTTVAAPAPITTCPTPPFTSRCEGTTLFIMKTDCTEQRFDNSESCPAPAPGAECNPDTFEKTATCTDDNQLTTTTCVGGKKTSETTDCTDSESYCNADLQYCTNTPSSLAPAPVTAPATDYYCPSGQGSMTCGNRTYTKEEVCKQYWNPRGENCGANCIAVKATGSQTIDYYTLSPKACTTTSTIQGVGWTCTEEIWKQGDCGERYINISGNTQKIEDKLNKTRNTSTRLLGPTTYKCLSDNQSTSKKSEPIDIPYSSDISRLAIKGDCVQMPDQKLIDGSSLKDSAGAGISNAFRIVACTPTVCAVTPTPTGGQVPIIGVLPLIPGFGNRPAIPTVPPTPTPIPVNNVTLALSLNVQDLPATTSAVAANLTANLSLSSFTTNSVVDGAPSTQLFSKSQIPGRQYAANVQLTGLAREKYFLIARKDNMIAKAVFTISSANQTIAVPTTLVFGDLNNDNQINISDYNIFRDCWKKAAAGACTSSDFDKSGGTIDQVDYNTWIRGLAVWNQEGK